MIAKSGICSIVKIVFVMIIPSRLKSQQCDRVNISDFPVKDRQIEIETKKIKFQDPYIYYYGIGVEVDYIKARQLAFIDIGRNSRTGTEIDGYTILMMLYANGFGVEKNLDLSIRLACGNVGGSQAEVEGRVQHLNDLKTGVATGIFDVCDDITSGYMDGVCHSIQSSILEVERKRETDSILSRWTEQERIAYTVLRKAADTFFDNRAILEVDLTGTSRAAFSLAESDDLEDEFLNKIKIADSCSPKRYSKIDFLKADKKLNKVYSEIKNDSTAIYGSVTKEGVRKTERKWIRYRNAWLTFASIKCSMIPSIYWKTMLTLERIEELESIAENQY